MPDGGQKQAGPHSEQIDRWITSFGAAAPGDECGSPIDRGVEYDACTVVTLVARGMIDSPRKWDFSRWRAEDAIIGGRPLIAGFIHAGQVVCKFCEDIKPMRAFPSVECRGRQYMGLRTRRTFSDPACPMPSVAWQSGSLAAHELGT